MIKVAFILPHLEVGGAERVITTIVNNLNNSEFDPFLVLFHKQGKLLHELNPNIKVIDLNTKIRYSFLKLRNVIRRNKPDIVFFGLGEMNAYIAPFIHFFPLKPKYICRETNIPSIHLFGNNKLLLLYRLFYNNYDHIIAQSDDMKNDIVKLCKISPYKITKINNPADVNKILPLSKESTEIFESHYKNILAVGTLTKRKGFDTLVKVFSNLAEKNYRLYIIGKDRGYKSLIEKEIKQFGLEKKVFLLGEMSNPYKFMHSCDLFILSSQYEGFPNVVVEALICGAPVLSNNCKGGIIELIDEGINGGITDMQDSLQASNKIENLLKVKFDRQSISKNAVTYYGNKSIVPLYERLFHSLI